MPPFDEKDVVEQAADRGEVARGLKRNLQPLRVGGHPRPPLRAVGVGVGEQLVEPHGCGHGSASSTVITRTGPSLSARMPGSIVFRSPTTTTAKRDGWMYFAAAFC